MRGVEGIKSSSRVIEHWMLEQSNARLLEKNFALKNCLGDFYKLPFRKFRENIWKIVGGNEGAMRALWPSDCQIDTNIILNLRKSSLSLPFVLKSFERGIFRKPLYCVPEQNPLRFFYVFAFTEISKSVFIVFVKIKTQDFTGAIYLWAFFGAGIWAAHFIFLTLQ